MDRTPDAFTVGNKASYDQALKEPEPVQKVGRRTDLDGKGPYPGGCVWRTEAEARDWLEEAGDQGRTGSSMIDFGNGPVLCDVYGLVLPNGWGEDVYLSDEDGLHHLVNDAEIVPASTEPTVFRALLDRVPEESGFQYSTIRGHRWLVACSDGSLQAPWADVGEDGPASGLLSIPSHEGRPDAVRDFLRRRIGVLERKGCLLVPYSVRADGTLKFGLAFAPGRGFIGEGHTMNSPLADTADGIADAVADAMLVDDVMKS